MRHVFGRRSQCARLLLRPLSALPVSPSAIPYARDPSLRLVVRIAEQLLLSGKTEIRTWLHGYERSWAVHRTPTWHEDGLRLATEFWNPSFAAA